MSLAYYARNAATAERNRRRMRKEGMTMKGDKLWTDEENEIVRTLAPDHQAIRKKLPHRTHIAIRSHCVKLGLGRKGIHWWTGAEISKLRKLYPSATQEEICQQFPHSTWVNIRQVARYHGFRRKRREYKETGVKALDQVRAKCQEIKWTMVDLDKASRTKNYFYKAGWIGKKVNHRALGRAIEALEGQVEANWKEEQ